MKFSSKKSVAIIMTCAFALGTYATVLTAKPVAAASKVTINVWEQDETNIDQTFDKLNKAFEKKYPNIVIKRSHYKTEELRNQAQTAIIAGKGPDLILGPNDNVGLLAKSSMILPLDNFMPKSFWKKLDPKALATVKISKKIWMIPDRNGNNISLIYNKKLVKTPPKSFNDIIKFAKTFNNPAKKKYALTYNENEPFWFVGFLGAFNGTVFDKNDKATLNTTAMKKALQFVQDLKYKYKVIPMEADYNAAETAFVNGNAAMLLNGSWAFTLYKNTKKMDIGIVNSLTVPGGGKCKFYFGTKGYSVSRNVKTAAKKDAVKKYLEFMLTNTKNQIDVMKATAQVPTLLAAKNSSATKADSLVSAAKDQMEYGEPMPIRAEMRAVWDAIRPSLEDVMNNKTTASKAAKKMQDDYKVKVKGL